MNVDIFISVSILNYMQSLLDLLISYNVDPNICIMIKYKE